MVEYSLEMSIAPGCILDTGLDKLIRLLQENDSSTGNLEFSTVVHGYEDDPAMKRFYQFYFPYYDYGLDIESVREDIMNCIIESQNNRFKDTVKGRICAEIFASFFQSQQQPNPERVLGLAIAQVYVKGNGRLMDIDLAAELDNPFANMHLLPSSKRGYSVDGDLKLEEVRGLEEQLAKSNRNLERLMAAARILQEDHKVTANLAGYFAMLGMDQEMHYWLGQTAQRGLRNPAVNSKRKFLDDAKTVFTIDLPEFKGLIFKEGKQTSIEDEVQKTIIAASPTSTIPGEEYAYSKPITMVEGEQKNYLVFRDAGVSVERTVGINWVFHGAAITFNSALQYMRNRLEENIDSPPEWWDGQRIYQLAKDIYIKRAIKSIARMQTTLAGRENPNLPPLNYSKHLEERVMGKVQLQPELYAKISRVAHSLDSMPRYISHGDFHLENTLAIGKVGTCVVDFQKACMADRFYDLAFLLEQAELELTEDEKAAFVTCFAGQLTKDKTPEAPAIEYGYTAAYINLIEAAFHGDKECKYYNPEESNMHLQRAARLLQDLDI